MKKRTDIDFSKHKLFITQQDGLLVHDLKIPSTVCYRVKFINTNGILAVTGDFGNWIFCNEFHPGPDEHVSDNYWIGKLKVSSTQVADEFDSDATRELIMERIKDLKSDPDSYHNPVEIMEYYKNECLQYVDCQEWEYVKHAFGDEFIHVEVEDVPFEKRIKHRLLLIFDAFDEICHHLKEGGQ